MFKKKIYLQSTIELQRRIGFFVPTYFICPMKSDHKRLNTTTQF
jgi:hypothetical protein